MDMAKTQVISTFLPILSGVKLPGRPARPGLGYRVLGFGFRAWGLDFWAYGLWRFAPISHGSAYTYTGFIRPTLAPMLCFQPLGVGRRVLETGGG